MIAINLNNFDVYNIIFGEKIKNNIIENSDFYNIHYSTELFTLNNLTLYFDLENTIVENYFNKYKCMFNYNTTNNVSLYKLVEIEENILKKFPTSKKKVFKLKNQIEKNNFKIFSKKQLTNNKYNTLKLILKISGIWENENECGIIYKFIQVI